MTGHTDFARIKIAIIAIIAYIASACVYNLDIQKNVVFDKEGGVVKLKGKNVMFVEVDYIISPDGKRSETCVYAINTIGPQGQAYKIFIRRDSLDWLTAETVSEEPLDIRLYARPNDTGKRRSMKIVAIGEGPPLHDATISVVQE